MLTVTKILEGGIDLTSGAKIEQGIVISNGTQELTLPLDQEDVEKVALLYIQMVEASPAPVKRGKKVKEEKPPVKLVQQETPVEEDYENPSSDSDDDEGFEPGEDYADSGTGVGSV